MSAPTRSAREPFSGGPSRIVCDAMAFFICLEVLSMSARYMASREYSKSLSHILIWTAVYGIALLFRRRGGAS